jgi:hypothetical protein
MTSGFWPRVRARALRAPVFLGSLPNICFYSIYCIFHLRLESIANAALHYQRRQTDLCSFSLIQETEELCVDG